MQTQTQPKKKEAFGKFSKIKIVVYDNHNINRTFKSFYKKDKKLTYEELIKDLKERVLVKTFNNKFKNAQIYNNLTDKKIGETIYPNDILKEFPNNKVKLLVYLKNGGSVYENSNEQEDQQEIPFIVGSMVNRYLMYKYRGKFTCAIFYDTINDNEIDRYTPYGRVQK